MQRVAISGSSGLIGSALSQALGKENIAITRIVRGSKQTDAGSDNSSSTDHADANQALWDQQANTLQAKPLEAQDAVVHLAGESLPGLWTQSKRRRIRRSRVEGTTLLCRTLAGLEHKPKVLICASAIGIYGDRGDEILTEQSLPGDAGQGFLSSVCQQWEQATAPADEAGIRVVNLRIGAMVLSTAGGALAWMLPVFKAGLGGVLGSGKQWMSWITLNDLVGVIRHCLIEPTLVGPVNALTPSPLTNKAFTKTLGQVIHRPTFARIPSWALIASLGDPAREMLLPSSRVKPQKLNQAEHPFEHTQLQAALESLL